MGACHGKPQQRQVHPVLYLSLIHIFHQPETFLKLGNRLLVLPVPDEPPAEKPTPSPRQSMTAKSPLLRGR